MVGHSSGACLAMRLLEELGAGKESALAGVILVAAAHTDLGDPEERRSGYFNRPWDYESMKRGADRIHQFHSSDDHLIPVAEGRHIAKHMKGENFQFTELDGKSHFFEPFPELLEAFDAISEAHQQRSSQVLDQHHGTEEEAPRPQQSNSCNLWCEHEDCVESLECFGDGRELARHAAGAHS